MKVLVLGTGAREHALVIALGADPDVEAVIAAPGNPGMAMSATCEPVDLLDPEAVTALARRYAVDLVVIGPEAPLVAGIADAVREAGFACYGPSAEAARLEGSKAFAKDVMAAAGVPTGTARLCVDLDEVAVALTEFGAPHVVKDDGLAAGKGVVVTDDRDVALAHAQACLAKEGGRVVIEEFLDGPEVSLFVVCDGTEAVPLTPAQDFKRVADFDAGPNTGGMGAYSPLPWAPAGLTEDLVERVARPVVAEMARRGTPFVGTLFIGLAMTATGPRVIEFNARFGDPETQVVLARLRSPLGRLLHAAATGDLATHPPLAWSEDAAVTVVVAAQGYPGRPRSGDVIEGLAVPADAATAYVLHAGTVADTDGTIRSAGGRVLSVVALGADLAQARERVYATVGRITLAGSHHRSDIALKAVRGEIDLPGTEAAVPGYAHVYSGKVRDLYAPLDAATGEPRDDLLLLVASDRISAFDFALEPAIPDKGEVLTRLSLWWFDQLADLVPNHVVSTDVPAEVAGRAVLVRRLQMLPVECVARAYLTGGGLREYRADGLVSGVALPPGLTDGSRLPEPVFTPSTKAPKGEHDEPMSYAQVEDAIGVELAAQARDLTTAILARGNELAAERGILIADTKVEFGVVDGALVLADEVLTPDSSRFWPAEQWEPGHPQPSFDKEFVREWLSSPASGWDRDSGQPPPPLPDDVVQATRAKYIEAFERLTGERF